MSATEAELNQAEVRFFCFEPSRLQSRNAIASLQGTSRELNDAYVFLIVLEFLLIHMTLYCAECGGGSRRRGFYGR